LKEVSSSITINSVIEDCYGNSNENLNNKMSGDFPKLAPGVNTISWIGSVNKVEVVTNWLLL